MTDSIILFRGSSPPLPGQNTSAPKSRQRAVVVQQPFRKIPAPKRLHPNASRRIIRCITMEKPLPGRVRDADSSCRVAEPGPSGRITAVLRFLQTRRRPFLSGEIRQKWRTTSALSPLVLPGMRNAGASRPRRRTPRNDVPSADDFARAPASGSAARRI